MKCIVCKSFSRDLNNNFQTGKLLGNVTVFSLKQRDTTQQGQFSFFSALNSAVGGRLSVQFVVVVVVYVGGGFKHPPPSVLENYAT